MSGDSSRQAAWQPVLKIWLIRGAVAAALLAYFNTAFNVHSQSWEFAARLPVELTVFVLLLALGGIWTRGRTVLNRAAGMLLAVAAILHLIDVASRAIYGRAVDLVFDAAQVPHVLELLASSMGWPLVAAATAAVIGFLILVALLFAGSVRYLAPSHGAALHRRRARFVGAGLALLFCLQLADLNGMQARNAFASSAPVYRAASYHMQIVGLWIDDGASVVDTYRTMRGEIRDGTTTLPALKDTDVYLIFVESYGASLLERPAHRATLAKIYEEYAERFRDRGVGSVGALLESPTYGGLSWLAHLTATAGAWIDSNLEYRAFLRSDLDTLPSILRRTGHATSLFMPGIKRFWPEGDLMRFDHVHTARDFDYQGVLFGYFGIPDQFTLERVPAMMPSRGPRFVQVAMISSHYPFRPLPPFIADRDRVLDADVWAEAAEAAGSFTRKDWADPADGYIAGAEYALRSAFDFADRHTGPDDLVIIMGDHQPWSIVSGRLGGRAAPIHVLSGRRDLLGCFREDGYTDGLVPPRGKALYGMDWLLQRLIAHFGDRSEPGRCGAPVGS